MWSLFCPNEAPGLQECHGEAFEVTKIIKIKIRMMISKLKF